MELVLNVKSIKGCVKDGFHSSENVLDSKQHKYSLAPSKSTLQLLHG